jgi:preprotein translocase subunit SecE
MNNRAEERFNFDIAKWALASSILVGGIYGNVYYSAVEPLYRALVGVIISAVIIAIVLTTEKGWLAWTLLKEARVEIRKVVWPTSQETGQTTLMVVGIVLLVGLLLWILDALLSWGLSGTIG